MKQSAPLSSMGLLDMLPCLEQRVTALKRGVNNVQKVQISSDKLLQQESSRLRQKVSARLRCMVALAVRRKLAGSYASSRRLSMSDSETLASMG